MKEVKENVDRYLAVHSSRLGYEDRCLSVSFFNDDQFLSQHVRCITCELEAADQMSASDDIVRTARYPPLSGQFFVPSGMTDLLYGILLYPVRFKNNFNTAVFGVVRI
jgi:hypothetical protein